MLNIGDDCEDRIAEVEYDFKYKDLECFITLSKFGWRCAYIKLPKGHKYHGRQPQSLCFIDCHGGITFAGTSNVCISTTNDEWIIGWDYNHLYDFVCFTLSNLHFFPIPHVINALSKS